MIGNHPSPPTREKRHPGPPPIVLPRRPFFNLPLQRHSDVGAIPDPGPRHPPRAPLFPPSCPPFRGPRSRGRPAAGGARARDEPAGAADPRGCFPSSARKRVGRFGGGGTPAPRARRPRRGPGACLNLRPPGPQGRAAPGLFAPPLGQRMPHTGWGAPPAKEPRSSFPMARCSRTMGGRGNTTPWLPWRDTL